MDTNQQRKDIEEAINAARARSSLKIFNSTTVKKPKVGNVLYGRKTIRVDEKNEQKDIVSDSLDHDISEFHDNLNYEESNKSIVVNDLIPKSMKNTFDNSTVTCCEHDHSKDWKKHPILLQ